MRLQFFFMSVVVLFIMNKTNAQLTLNAQFVSHGKQYVIGPGISIGNEFLLNDKFSTTIQLGGMWLWKYDDFVDGKFKLNIYQFTQLLSYKLINKPKYRLCPSIGLNYNIIRWHAKLNPPYNQLPIRASVTEFGKGYLIVSSEDNLYKDHYYENSFGVIVQLKNTFKLNDKISFNIVPFYGDTFSGGQNHGGVIFGILYSYK